MANLTEGDAPQRHWVEELFPPFFKVSICDLSQQPKQAEDGSQEAWRISQQKKVREIYEEVKNRMDEDAKKPKDKCIQAGASLGESKHRVKLKGEVRRVQGTSDSEGMKQKGSVQENKTKVESNIWSSGEMAILRPEFQAVKHEKQIITLKLKAMNSENKELRQKYKQQRHALNASTGELDRSRQECRRLVMQNQHLIKEVKLQQSKVVMAEQDYREIVEQRLSFRRDITDLRKCLAKSKHVIKDLEINVSEAERKHKLDMMAREDAMKVDYESQIARLCQELEETRTDLDKERLEHGRSRKALDHLRQHFVQHAGNANQPLPLSDGMMKLNVLQLF